MLNYFDVNGNNNNIFFLKNQHNSRDRLTYAKRLNGFKLNEIKLP